jgi:flagellar biosynthesis protein FliQ
VQELHWDLVFVLIQVLVACWMGEELVQFVDHFLTEIRVEKDYKAVN